MNEGKKIYAAIPSILADVEAIGKDRKNKQQGWSFRGIDDVYNAIHPLFSKHKVFPTCEIVSRDVTERESRGGGALFCVSLKAKYTLWAEDGSNVVTEAWGEAMDSGDKATNKAMSVAYKYAMFQLLCIPTEVVDPDVEIHEPKPASRNQSGARSGVNSDRVVKSENDENPDVKKTVDAIDAADSEERLDEINAKVIFELVKRKRITEDDAVGLRQLLGARRAQLKELQPA